MKECPLCKRTYADETLTFCLVDGSVLSPPYDATNPDVPPQPTVRFRQGIRSPLAETVPARQLATQPEPRDDRSKRAYSVIALAGLLLGGVALVLILKARGDNGSRLSQQAQQTQQVQQTPSANLSSTAASDRTQSANETESANELVDEGNAAVQEARRFVTDAEEKKGKMLQKDSSELAEARTLAKESIAAYDKAADKCKEAARKYEEASKLKIKEKFKEYLTLKTREYNKRAEVVEAAKGTPQALLDSESRSSFVKRANENNEKVDKLTKEAEDLAAQADKILRDNKSVFKS